MAKDAYTDPQIDHLAQIFRRMVLVLMLGFSVVVGMLGFMIYQALTRPVPENQPLDVQVMKLASQLKRNGEAPTSVYLILKYADDDDLRGLYTSTGMVQEEESSYPPRDVCPPVLCTCEAPISCDERACLMSSAPVSADFCRWVVQGITSEPPVALTDSGEALLSTCVDTYKQ